MTARLDNIPMLAESVDVKALEAFIHDARVALEQKLDGHRILLRVQDGLSPLALTRGGQPYTKRLPADLTKGLPPGRWVLDGELVDGVLWVFDMLDANGLIDETTSFADRRNILEAFMTLVSTPCIRLVPQAWGTEEKKALVDKCRKQGAEGVMVKYLHAPYHPGARSPNILKAKFVETADVVVLAVRDDGKDSVRLGAYDASDNLVDVGRASLIGKEKRGPINVGDVLEVRYLYMGAGERLYQPTILRKRTDKKRGECDTRQFKHVSKAVLASL